MSALLPPERFSAIFEPIAGKRVLFRQGRGNAGDALIEAGTRQFFRRFGIETVNDDQRPDLAQLDIAAAVWGGGGNMGTVYAAAASQRERIARLAVILGVPLIILPQSFWRPAPTHGAARVYVRDRRSLQLCKGSLLFPDLALAFDPRADGWTPAEATEAVGLWLRRDVEARFAHVPSEGDPAEGRGTAIDYLNLAARYKSVVTDRLHFAIAAMIAGRRATLLPNAYHKNWAVYQTWLADLGCEWAESPSAVGASVEHPSEV